MKFRPTSPRRALAALTMAAMLGAGAAAAQTASGAPAQPGSGATAAPSPDHANAPASPAALDSSLDTVIETLQNDQSRAALIAQLKALRSASAPAPAAAGQGSPAAAGSSSPPPAPPKLISAVASGFGSIETELHDEDTVVRFWQRRLKAAAGEIDTLSARSPETFWQGVWMFVRVLAIGGAIAAALLLLVRWVDRLLRLPRPLPPDARTRDLLVYLVGRIGSWLIALYSTVELVVRPTPSLGRMLALTLFYTVVWGAVFTTVCLLLFSLFSNGHRKQAFRILRRRAPILLFPIGILAAAGDVAERPRVLDLLGHDLAICISTFANLGAATLLAYSVLRLRRPIAHLIRDSGYTVRHANRFNHETLRLFAAAWHLPMLLLVTLSSAVTVLSIHRDSDALRLAIANAGLLVLGFFGSAMIQRGFVQWREYRARRSRAAPYTDRFLKVFHVLLVVALWLAVVELSSQLWGASLWDWLNHDAYGQRIGRSALGVGLTFLAGSVLWIVLDTAIREAITPSRPRRGHVPSTRALTVLPLLRNALFVVLVVLGVIATLANLGINVTPLIAGAGVIGIALGLGAQTLVKDLLTGVFILIEDTIAVGDVVEMDSRSGTVEGLTIRTVRVRDGDGAVHAIPFSEIKTIKNQSREFSYAVFNVRITYDSDVDEALKLIRETGAELLQDSKLHRDMIGSLEVFGLDKFDSGAVVLQSRIKTRPLKQYDVARAFNRKLKEKIDASATTNFATGVQMLRMLPGTGTPMSLPPPEEDPPTAAARDEESGTPHAV